VTGRLMSAQGSVPPTSACTSDRRRASFLQHDRLATASTRRLRSAKRNRRKVRTSSTHRIASEERKTARAPSVSEGSRTRGSQTGEANAEAGSSGGLAAPDSASRPASVEGDRKPQERRPIPSAQCPRISATEFRAAATSENRTGDDGFAREKSFGMIRPIGSADRTTAGDSRRGASLMRA
jgi:hypothetical protein